MESEKNKNLKYIANWYQHSIGVADLMFKKAKQLHWSKKKCNDMFILGFLHDIGKRVSDDMEFHNKVGGIFLLDKNYPYYQEIYYHGEGTPKYNSKELDLLDVCDTLIDEKGNQVSVKQRLQGIAVRYGKFSHAYKNSVKKIKRLQAKGLL